MINMLYEEEEYKLHIFKLIFKMSLMDSQSYYVAFFGLNYISSPFKRANSDHL